MWHAHKIGVLRLALVCQTFNDYVANHENFNIAWCLILIGLHIAAGYLCSAAAGRRFLEHAGNSALG